jgi:hypothetical protein
MEEHEVELVKWLADHKEFVYNKGVIRDLIRKEKIPNCSKQVLVESGSWIQTMILIGIFIIMLLVVLKG